jgi:hypothetical protein
MRILRCLNGDGRSSSPIDNRLHPSCETQVVGISSGGFPHEHVAYIGIEERTTRRAEKPKQSQVVRHEETLSTSLANIIKILKAVLPLFRQSVSLRQRPSLPVAGAVCTFQHLSASSVFCSVFCGEISQNTFHPPFAPTPATHSQRERADRGSARRRDPWISDGRWWSLLRAFLKPSLSATQPGTNRVWRC